MEKRDYLLKYWMDFYLNIDDDGDITLRTEHLSKTNPKLKYEISCYDEENLIAFLPEKYSIKLLEKFPDFTEEILNTENGKKILFPEKKLYEMEKILKISRKKFPSDKDLVIRFLNYYRKKLEEKKKRKKKKKRTRII
jgi:hypothetical protein